MSHNVRAERLIGLDARGLCREDSDRVDYSGLFGVKIHRSRVGRVVSKLILFFRGLYGIWWADVVHWYGSARLYGLERLVFRPKVHTWCGTDSRVPAIERLDNPYFREGEYAKEYARVDENMRRFGRYEPIAENPSVALYIRHNYLGRGIFPPENDLRDEGFVMHVGSQPITKGTDAVVPILRRVGAPYIVARDLPRSVTLALMAHCRVFVGQFRLGDIGIAEIEAMYLGKPVLAYIKPRCLRLYPKGLPVIVCTLDTLEKTLLELLASSKRRIETGRASREYATTYFDPVRLARKRKALYEAITP